MIMILRNAKALRNCAFLLFLAASFIGISAAQVQAGTSGQGCTTWWEGSLVDFWCDPSECNGYGCEDICQDLCGSSNYWINACNDTGGEVCTGQCDCDPIIN